MNGSCSSRYEVDFVALTDDPSATNDPESDDEDEEDDDDVRLVSLSHSTIILLYNVPD